MASLMWKDGTRRGIVYVEGREAAEKVLAVAKRPVVNRHAKEAALPKSIGKDTKGPKRVTRAASARQPAPAESFLEGTMAVYVDRRGRPFAWQIPFDIADWDQVTAAVGAG